MTTNATIFRAGPNNVADLATLRFQWRSEAGEKGLSPEGFELQFFEWFQSHRESHRGYLATIEGKAVGCAWLGIVERIPGPGRFLRRSGMVQSVYVQPAHRDVGVGTKLVEALISDARTLPLDYLSVHPSERSFVFYGRLGFEVTEKALELRFAR